MATYHATIEWTDTGPDFAKGRYSREHRWTFDGGLSVPASSSPHVVPLPWSKEAAVDPEEAFVASIASCHMLTWLYLAAKGGFHVSSYRDAAVGTMTKNERGALWVSQVKLHPVILYVGEEPIPEESARLHALAHDQCFIANSVRTEIVVAVH